MKTKGKIDRDIVCLKKAFLATIPVMAGYIVLGIGFGMLLQTRGYGVLWAFAMSFFIFAGSMQYVPLDLLVTLKNSQGRYCPTCGTTEKDVAESFKFGCADCYKHMRGLALTLADKVQEDLVHRGKEVRRG